MNNTLRDDLIGFSLCGALAALLVLVNILM
jgi:hypothetical protein